MRGSASISFALLLALGRPATAGQGALAQFVVRPDATTRWEQQSDRESGVARVIEAKLVSQTWKGVAWQHALRLTLPKAARPGDVAVLIIGEDRAGAYLDPAALAAAAGVPVAHLRNVPNQPLFGLSEDGLIAHTFEQYLKTQDPDWPLLFPMTKAAVKAMDAVGDLARRATGAEIRRFIVTGASKRGWTTWLTAVVDERVAGIVPVVFDNLNFGPQMKNQLAVWGRYSDQLGDYSERSLQALIGTERGRALVAMVDPFAYRASLARVPKLIVNGSNDPYWELDAVNLYWNDLPGPKSLLLVPNAGHGAGSDRRVVDTVAAFVDRIATGRAMPELHWEANAIAATGDVPAHVRIWRADSASRDFRAARWRAVEASREGDRFVAGDGARGEGFAAFFAEGDYETRGRPFTLSTPVRIEPAR